MRGKPHTDSALWKFFRLTRISQISQVLLLRVGNLTEALHRFAPMAHMNSALWGVGSHGSHSLVLLCGWKISRNFVGALVP